MRTKKSLSFVLVICMLFGLLAGCTQKTEPVAGNDQPEPETNNEAEETQSKMKPGTYTASATGFRLFEEVEVSVTVDETSILDIGVSMDNGETKPIFAKCVY